MYIIQRKNIPIPRNRNCAEEAKLVLKKCVSKQTEGYVLHNILCLVYSRPAIGGAVGTKFPGPGTFKGPGKARHVTGSDVSL